MDKKKYCEYLFDRNNSYDEIQDKVLENMPKMLVRYRTFNEQYTFDEMVNENVFLQYLNNQNDPFEGRFYISSERYMKEKKPFFEVLENLMGKKIDQKLFDKAFESIQPQMDRYTESIRIACFSESISNLLMWSHYTNSHKGVCIYYDTEKIISYIRETKGIYFLPVVYSEDLFEATENMVTSSENIAINPALFKGKCWEYEQEWRLLSYDYGNKRDISKINFLGAIKRVDLGCKCTNDDRDKILSWCKTKGIEVYQNKLSVKRFDLEQYRLF